MRVEAPHYLTQMETGMETILQHDITVKDAVRQAEQSGLVLCMNKAGNIAILDKPKPGWYRVGGMARLVKDVWEAAS